MVNMPKTMKRFCRYKCRKHTTHKVIQYNDKNENNNNNNNTKKFFH